MGLEVLVPVVMGALLSAAGKVAGKVGAGALNAVEEQAKKTANAVADRIRSWWSGDEVASADLERFEQEPDIYQPVVERRLVERLTDDPAMQRELAALLEGQAPQVEVLQTIAEANGVTGARVDEMRRGTLRVEQRIEKGENVTGADITRLG
jgi:hypothetical protein